MSTYEMIHGLVLYTTITPKEVPYSLSYTSNLPTTTCNFHAKHVNLILLLVVVWSPSPTHSFGPHLATIDVACYPRPPSYCRLCYNLKWGYVTDAYIHHMICCLYRTIT